MEYKYLTVGRKLTVLRNVKGMLTKDVIKTGKVSSSALWAYESNMKVPPLEILQRLCVLYDTTLSDFFADIACNSTGSLDVQSVYEEVLLENTKLKKENEELQKQLTKNNE